MSKCVGKTARRKQAAMDRQIGAALRAMVGEPGDNRTLMQWNPPTEPVERIAKLLLALADQGYQPYQVFKVDSEDGQKRAEPDLPHSIAECD